MGAGLDAGVMVRQEQDLIGVEFFERFAKRAQHQPIDVLTTFTDKDYMLGLTSAQTTLGALGQMIGATVRK